MNVKEAFEELHSAVEAGLADLPTAYGEPFLTPIVRWKSGYKFSLNCRNVEHTVVFTFRGVDLARVVYGDDGGEYWFGGHASDGEYWRRDASRASLSCSDVAREMIAAFETALFRGVG